MGRRSDCKGQRKLKPLLVLLLLSQAGCFLPYVIKQGAYQIRLSSGALPVDKVLTAPNLNDETRNKLNLIGALRRFSMTKLGMKNSKNYTSINLNWHYKLYNISASKELSFEPYLWSFPIIGQMPYLGFFDEWDALIEEQRLRDLCYDTMKGEAGAYSTLGFFNDPIWPQMLKRSMHSLSELVLHELTHSTLYFPSQSTFNESLANFVGRVASLQFLQRNYGSHSFELYDAIFSNEDEDLYLEWINTTYERLDKVYKSDLSDSEKRRQKKEEIQNAQHAFREIRFRSQAYQGIKAPKINNAYLLMSKRYNSNQGDFERLFIALKGDWLEFFNKLRTLESAADPFKAIKNLASQYDLGES